MKNLLVAASFALGVALFCGASQAALVTHFSDHFDDGIVGVNGNGVGGNWTVVHQDAPVQTLHAPNTEAASNVTLSSATASFNIGGMKTMNEFAAGSVVQVVVTGVARNTVSTAGSNVGPFQTAGNLAVGAATINIASPLNTLVFPNAYHNSGRYALSVDIILSQQGQYGFQIQRNGNTTSSGVTVASGIFDGAAPVSTANPITVSILPNGDGTYSVGFSRSYNSGLTAAFTSNFGPHTSTPDYRLAIGAQGFGTHGVEASFDRVNISPIPEPASGAMLAAAGLVGLFLARKRHVLRVA